MNTPPTVPSSRADSHNSDAATFGSPANTLGLNSPALTPQNLSDDSFIHKAPRIDYNGTSVPALGGIALLAKLGQGGMGAVYLGLHLRLNTEVAVKVLPFHLAEANADALRRFTREAQLAAHVQSPHLVGVLDVNHENGLHFLVMEFVRGQSAQSYLKQCKASGLPGVHEAVALDICIAATTGLAAAHTESIVHRDVKPDNIMLPQAKNSSDLHFQSAKLSDLGLAYHSASSESITQTGICMGTPGYMAPEQINDSKDAGPAADVFSMGATLYALLAGAPPFTGATLMKAFQATLEQAHAPIRTLRPEISQLTAVLIDCALAKAPTQRFPNATALLTELKSAHAKLHIDEKGDLKETKAP